MYLYFCVTYLYLNIHKYICVRQAGAIVRRGLQPRFESQSCQRRPSLRCCSSLLSPALAWLALAGWTHTGEIHLHRYHLLLLSEQLPENVFPCEAANVKLAPTGVAKELCFV